MKRFLIALLAVVFLTASLIYGSVFTLNHLECDTDGTHVWLYFAGHEWEYIVEGD